MSEFLDQVAAERRRLAEEVASRSTPEALAARDAQAAEAARRAAAPARLAGIVREFAAEMDRLRIPATHYFAVDAIPNPLRPKGTAARFAGDLGRGWPIGTGVPYGDYSAQSFSKWIVLRDCRVIVREGHHSEPQGDFMRPPPRPLFNTMGARNRMARTEKPLFEAPQWVFDEGAFGLDRVQFSDGINGMRDEGRPPSTLEEKMVETLAWYQGPGT